MSEPQLDPEQLLAELRNVKVSDLLAQTCSLLASLGYGKLSPEVGDLEQARVAIEALRVLGPLLEEGPRRDVQQVVANLQLAYADAAAKPQAGSEPEPEPEPEPEAPAEPEPEQAGPEPE